MDTQRSHPRTQWERQSGTNAEKVPEPRKDPVPPLSPKQLIPSQGCYHWIDLNCKSGTTGVAF